ncbi:MAG TPA: ArsR family transcriptional regulator [bacterium]|nr:ArsR family transcriptional regulator [bacterium]
MDEKITIDRKVFRSLASDTKINILKSLDLKRKILSELASELGMSVSTVKEHLDGLVKSGLIKQVDDGHKWKYYELTKTGNDILHPGSNKFMFILSAALLSMAAVLYDLFSPLIQVFGESRAFGQDTEMMLKSAPDMNDMITPGIMESAPAYASPMEPLTSSIPWIHITVLVILAVIIGAVLVYLFLNRKLKVTSI